MRDFRAFVRQRLPALDLPVEREVKIVDELAGHLEEAYASLLEEGLSEDEASAELERQSPSWVQLREELLAAEPARATLAHPERAPVAGPAKRALVARLNAVLGVGLVRDLRSALRLLVTDRGFTSTSLLTLAVCLGANVAIFTIVYAVLLRPLPVPDADRIVVMADQFPNIGGTHSLNTSPPGYVERLEVVTAVEDQATTRPTAETLLVDGRPVQVRGLRVTPSWFRLVRVPPAHGRGFTDDEGEIGNERRIVLSYGLWQELYGGDPTAIGRVLQVTGHPFTVVGVMPRGFSFMSADVRFWVPLAFTPDEEGPAARFAGFPLINLGRLRSDATLEQAQAQLDAVTTALLQRIPEAAREGLLGVGFHSTVEPLQDALVRDVRQILYLLWGAAAFVLLIGTINMTSLALARSHVRARELATRLALGAGRWRVTRQLVLESVVLAGLGGLASLAVSVWILRAMVPDGVAQMPTAGPIRLDVTVVGFTAAIAGLVGIAIGLVPAAGLRRLNLNQVLRNEGRSVSSGRGLHLLRRGLIVTQVTVSLVLLVGAGLLLASFRNLLAVDAGFVADQVVTAGILLPSDRYEDSTAVRRFTDEALQAIRRLPGVETAAVTTSVPLGDRLTTIVEVEGRQPQPDDAAFLPDHIVVSPGYFQAMTTPLIRGRYFDARDTETTLPVTIIDERFAARFWPNENPIGKRIYRIVEPDQRLQIVGVVREVRFDDLAGSAGFHGAYYVPHTQAPAFTNDKSRFFTIKTAVEPEALIGAVRGELLRLDPELPLFDVRTMNERIAGSLASRRMALNLAGAFGVVALFLSALGLYGVLSYLVTQRRREIGVRIALGSTADRVFALVLREGLVLVGLGLILGLTGALALGRLLEGQLFGVTPTDPVLLGTVALLTGAVALLACVSPARRATRVDPLVVLSDS